MKIEKNKIVSVTYELKVKTGDEDSEVAEVADETKPLIFPYGAKYLLPAFENALDGKQTGDKFEIEMDAENGYGLVNEQMVISIPKNSFEVEGKIDDEMVKVGNMLPMKSQDGNILNGLVKSVDESNVVLDFNHPLAGKDLYFTGEILDVRDATEDELKEFDKKL